MLRIPGWCEAAGLRVNGEASDEPLKPGTYVELKRAWKAGDLIELTLPLRPRMIKAHPKAEEIRNHVAVTRGPIVYCLEGMDLPDGVSILEVFAPDDMSLEAKMESELLGGVVTIEGQARRLYEDKGNGSLYLEAGMEQEEALDIRLIPYYAWNNRGIDEMTVWLPRRF